MPYYKLVVERDGDFFSTNSEALEDETRVLIGAVVLQYEIGNTTVMPKENHPICAFATKDEATNYDDESLILEVDGDIYTGDIDEHLKQWVPNRTVFLRSCTPLRLMEKDECDICGRSEWDIEPMEVYENPFEDSSSTILVCESCWDDGYFYEEYELCESCDRYIAKSKGMRAYMRFDFDGPICVDCLQKEWFETGMPRSIFEGDGLDGDFFDYEDLEINGFVKVASYAYGMGYSNNHGMADIQRCKDKALELIDAGKKVIIDIEASGMGLGGYFGLWAKCLSV